MWGFHLLLHFSLSQCLSLPSLSLLPLCSFAFSMLLYLFLCLNLCLYISLSSCQTFLPANLKHCTLTMPLLFLLPTPHPSVPTCLPQLYCTLLGQGTRCDVHGKRWREL